MRLIEFEIARDEAELTEDACWQAGAAGIWTIDHEPGPTILLRVGVDEAAVADVEAAVGAAGIDITDRDAVALATQVVTLDVGGRQVTVTVPPTVFGDGAHPTTAACVDAVAGLVGPGSTVLDVGCGSGVLSVAAAVAGGTVRAIDIDPLAADTTEANATAAGVTVEADTTPLADIDHRYDVVLANITAGHLLPLVDDLRRCTASGGRLVVSGIWAPRWDEVRDAVGWEVEARVVVEDWVTATLVAP